MHISLLSRGVEEGAGAVLHKQDGGPATGLRNVTAAV